MPKVYKWGLVAASTVVVGGLWVSEAIARDPRQAVIGDAELAKLSADEQQRLGHLEQGQDGLFFDSQPEPLREGVAHDDLDASTIEGFDDGSVIQEAGLTIVLPEAFNGSIRRESTYTSPEAEPTPSTGAAQLSLGDSEPAPVAEQVIVMYDLLYPESGGTLSIMTGVERAEADATQEWLTTQADAEVLRVGDKDVVRTGGSEHAHMQWVSTDGTVISLSSSDFTEETMLELVLAVNGD